MRADTENYRVGCEAIRQIQAALEAAVGPRGVAHSGWVDGFRIWKGRHTGRYFALVQQPDGHALTQMRDTEAEAVADARAMLGLPG